MKIFGACFVSVALTAAVLLWLLPDQGERCETIVAQERAGYQTVVQVQRKIIDDYTRRLDQKRKEVVELQDSYARHLAEKVGTIDDVMAIPVSALPTAWTGSNIDANSNIDAKIRYKQTTNGPEPEVSIESLAARLTPVEAKAKEEAKQHGGWINVPWLKEQLWKGAAMAYGMRGK